ncbi:MAG: TolC family protein [SAR324 cluster bacterium]
MRGRGSPASARRALAAGYIGVGLLAAVSATAQAQVAVPSAGTPAAPASGSPKNGSAALADAAAVPVLTLAEAIRTALETNRNVGIARRRVGIAQDLRKEANARYFPTVTVDASTAQRDNEPLAKLNVGGRLAIVPQGDEYTAVTHSALVLPLYDFGRTSSASEAARLGVDAAGLNAQRTEQDIALQVSQAYYRVLQAQKIRQVVLDSIATVDLQLKDAQAFFAQGIVASSDVLSAEVRRAERQQDLITAEANLQVALATLNRVMGQDLNRKQRLQDVSGQPDWSGNYDTLVRTAHESRSDLKAARLQMLSSEADLQAARAENWPRLSAFAEYDTNSTSFFVHKEWTTTGVAFSMTLFSGGAQSATIEQRQKEVLQAQDQFLEQQDNISLDVKQAYLTAGQTFDSVQVTEKEQQLAVENLRIYRDQYSQGLVTSTDVLTAEDVASRARSNYYQSLYDYYTALARLDNVVGQSK